MSAPQVTSLSTPRAVAQGRGLFAEHPVLLLYRLAWIAVFPLLRAAAALDLAFRGLTRGRGFLPGRWRVRERLGLAWEARPEGERLWLHCASLGEAKGLWALLPHLPEGWGEVVVTATSAAGLAYLENRCRDRADAGMRENAGIRPDLGIRAVMAPLDHPGLAERFVAWHRVRGLCLYEVELWPHYIRACARRGAPVALVSARCTARAVRGYRRLRGAWARLLLGLDWIQAQGEEDARNFRELSGAAVSAGFDCKAARYLQVSPQASSAPRTRFALLSLHAGELARLLPALPGLLARFDLIVFPRRLREMPRFRAALEPLGFTLHSRDPSARHLLVDAYGWVERILPACHSALVGGSLVPVGCHNLWEPLAAGLKIYFGPYFHNQEKLARLLLAGGVAEVVGDPPRADLWRAPGPEIGAACAAIRAGQTEALQRALGDFRGRMEEWTRRKVSESPPMQNC